MKKYIAAAFLLFAAPAFAQTVQQSGNVTRNHLPVWVTSGVIADGGSSADSPISSIGVTNNGGSGICVNSARQTAAGYNALCLGASTAGAATISLQNFGTAGAQSLQFVINGTTYAFPGSLANITIGVTPVIGGTNTNCLFVSGGVVGQQACQLSAITSLTGDVTAAGPGVSVATLATVNSNTGTFGSGSVVPVITVNGKGLITAVSTSNVGVTIGSSTITSGSNNGMLYDNGGVFGNLSTLGSAVLATNSGGVPAMVTTLPSSLTIPTPTFTGTLTFPDAATWTAAGISKVSALSAGSATIPSAGNININGQYQVNGSQIAASNLSNGTTGSGSVVLATSPTMAGTWAGSVTFSGALTLSGNDTFTAQAIHQGTSAPASAGGNTVVMGTIAAPTLTNTGQAFLYNTAANGAVLEGDGSSFDVVIANKAGTAAMQLTTNTTVPVWPGLASGTCSSGLGLDASNNMVKVSCPGAASSIQVGTTTITSGSSGNIEYNNAGTLGELTPNGGTVISSSNLQVDGNYTGWGLSNCTLAASVGSNLLTVALKDNAGSDPSATSPCNINYRSVTAATGSTSLVKQTAALSISTNATGATLGSINNVGFRFWVVAFNNAGTNVLALYNASTNSTTAPSCLAINEGIVQSSTAISGSATSAGVYYTPNGTTVTSKAIRILGYVEYNSTGLATAGTYASGPNFIQTFGPGVVRPCQTTGNIVEATTTTTDTGSTSTTYAASAFTASITPSSAANIVRASASVVAEQSGTNNISCHIQRGATWTTASAVTTNAGATGQSTGALSTGLDFPNAITSTTYTVYRRTNNAATTANCPFINSATEPAAIILEEIMG